MDRKTTAGLLVASVLTPTLTACNPLLRVPEGQLAYAGSTLTRSIEGYGDLLRPKGALRRLRHRQEDGGVFQCLEGVACFRHDEHGARSSLPGQITGGEPNPSLDDLHGRLAGALVLVVDDTLHHCDDRLAQNLLVPADDGLCAPAVIGVCRPLEFLASQCVERKLLHVIHCPLLRTARQAESLAPGQARPQASRHGLLRCVDYSEAVETRGAYSDEACTVDDGPNCARSNAVRRSAMC